MASQQAVSAHDGARTSAQAGRHVLLPVASSGALKRTAGAWNVCSGGRQTCLSLRKSRCPDVWKNVTFFVYLPRDKPPELVTIEAGARLFSKATGKSVSPVTGAQIMARVLDKFTFPAFGGGAKESHPWQEWSDGKIRELKVGTDFECKLQTICQQARNYGKKNGLKVRRLRHQPLTVHLGRPKGSKPVAARELTASCGGLFLRPHLTAGVRP
jgi:hypothetical protein